ncbi:hypothetical protein KFE25_003868 [Diacronema lutheri]|uniref:Gamma carbonic anhydrase n=1 Tax=Diacronema lutheri TaxID=2081491 RepID=A0A8J6CBD5_DIALT|nr:hypothetical protein KFE25_003868 [Diacronema lutheri]
MAAKYLEMSKPPGPAAFWFGLGAAIRSVGKAVDEAGRLMQMETGHDEKLPIPCTVVTVGAKAPTIGQSFVAPSATVAGDVMLDTGASVWYGAVVRAHGSRVTIGEMSCVQENAIVTSKPTAPVSVGKLVTIGAGSLVEGATLLDGCSVGPGCVVSPGSSIGAKAILAAGSVLAPKATVPAGQLWAGKPAKKVGDVTAADADGAVADARAMCALSIVHSEHAWMSLDDIEFTALQYKIEGNRPENWNQLLRDAPSFEEMPKLRTRIAEVTAQLG